MLEAKDTVLSPKQLQTVAIEYANAIAPFKTDTTDTPLHQRLREAQAEITWKARDGEIEAARQEAIKEVVEWIELVPPVNTLPEGNMKHYAVSIEQWQAFKKSKGIK